MIKKVTHIFAVLVFTAFQVFPPVSLEAHPIGQDSRAGQDAPVRAYRAGRGPDLSPSCRTHTARDFLSQESPLSRASRHGNQFSGKDLIELITTELLPHVTLESLELIDSANPRVVGAVARESGYPGLTHVFLYSSKLSSDGKPKLLLRTQHDVFRPLGGVTIDDTGRIAIIREGSIYTTPSGDSVAGTLSVYRLGEEEAVLTRLIPGGDPDQVRIMDRPGKKITIEFYPNGDLRIPGGTQLKLKVTKTGVEVVSENDHFLPAQVLETLPRTVSNDQFVIEERSDGTGSSEVYNVFSSDGAYLASFAKRLAILTYNGVSLNSIQAPDASPDGRFMAAGYHERRFYTGWQPTQYLRILSSDAAQELEERRISLRDPAQDLLTGVRFLGDSGHTIQVTYESGDVELYDAQTGERLPPPVPAGWTRAASNPNYAFREAAKGANESLYLLDLTHPGQEILIATGSIVRHNPFLFDVSPDGTVVAVAYHESGPTVGLLSEIVFYSVESLKAGNQTALTRIRPVNAESIKFVDGYVIVEATIRGPNYSQNGTDTQDVVYIASLASILAGHTPQPADPVRSNPNFLIVERDASTVPPDAPVHLILYDIYSKEGELVTSFVNERTFGFRSYTPEIHSLDLPDVSPDGKFAIHAYHQTLNSGVTVHPAHVLQIVEIPGNHATEIALRQFDQPANVQFPGGHGHTIQVTYESGDLEFYDAKTGEKLSRASTGSSSEISFGESSAAGMTR